MPCRQGPKDFPNAADGKQAAQKAKAFRRWRQPGVERTVFLRCCFRLTFSIASKRVASDPPTSSVTKALPQWGRMPEPVGIGGNAQSAC